MRDGVGRLSESGQNVSRLRKESLEEESQRRIRIGDRLIDAPKYGEVILTYHDGQLRYVEKRTKEKVD
ncbi:hypothetical protein ACOJUR_12240 [Alicyclobacillus tolerans]|uniref:hypothetical protein n=1 Tax=Alicyclobacillus tolerans TaxID=90970 RepID=UPI003B7C6AF3